MCMHFALYYDQMKEEVVGHEVNVRKKINSHRVLMGKPVRKNLLEDLHLDSGILTL